MKYLLAILVGLFVQVASGLANEQNSLTEKARDDTWTVEVVDFDKKDPKEWAVMASVNGKVQHGVRLRIRILPKEMHSCGYGNIFTYFYSVTSNKDTLNLQDVIIPAEFKKENIDVQILFAQPFLLGYAVFIDLGWNRLEELKQFFQDTKEVTLTLKDSEHLNISEYFDMPQETWSLNGFTQALDRAKKECETIVNMVNQERPAPIN